MRRDARAPPKAEARAGATHEHATPKEGTKRDAERAQRAQIADGNAKPSTQG